MNGQDDKDLWIIVHTEGGREQPLLHQRSMSYGELGPVLDVFTRHRTAERAADAYRLGICGARAEETTEGDLRKMFSDDERLKYVAIDGALVNRDLFISAGCSAASN